MTNPPGGVDSAILDYMVVLAGSTRTLVLLSGALLVGCGGRASAPMRNDGSSGSSASEAGTGAAPSVSGAAGGMAVVGGAPGAAGSSASQTAGGDAASGARAGAPSAAGNAAGGAPTAGSTGGAGAAGSQFAGAGNSAGAPPAVVAACTNLCSALEPCGNLWSFSATCKSDCSGDLTVQNGGCADLGIEMSDCLQKYLAKPSHSDCMADYVMAQQVCSAEFDAYYECTAGTGRAPQSNICAHADDAGANPGQCTASLACLDGGYYRLDCTDAADGQSSCTCISDPVDSLDPGADNTTFAFTVNETTAEACSNHIANCFDSRPPSQ